MPTTPHTGWTLSRVSLLLLVVAAAMATTALILQVAWPLDDQLRLLVRNCGAVVGLTLLLRRVPGPGWLVAPWLWLLAILAFGVSGGRPRPWALLVQDPSASWVAAGLMLGIGLASFVVLDARYSRR